MNDLSGSNFPCSINDNNFGKTLAVVPHSAGGSPFVTSGGAGWSLSKEQLVADTPSTQAKSTTRKLCWDEKKFIGSRAQRKHFWPFSSTDE